MPDVITSTTPIVSTGKQALPSRRVVLQAVVQSSFPMRLRRSVSRTLISSSYGMETRSIKFLFPFLMYRWETEKGI
jgi:hypothetical protein